jgi:hypothetical protein
MVRSCRRACVLAAVVFFAATLACATLGARAGQSAHKAVGWRASDPWAPLERPLSFPILRAGAHCPRSRGGSAAPRVGFTLGPGPAYPVLGTSAPDGVVRLGDDFQRGGWYLHKTIWAVSSRYRGRVLVRGRQIDGSGSMRFGFGRRLFVRRPQLRLGPAIKPGWRLAGSYTFVHGAGCYAFQVDGLSFSRILVFEVKR